MLAPYLNRNEAGKVLAKRLMPLANRADVLVLALPRGGVPVAFEVARALAVPLDVCLVRKLGVPQQPELAFGAIASNDITVLNPDIIAACKVSQRDIDRVIAAEHQELQRREQLYRPDRDQPDVTDKIVLLIDDGIATGATVKAAIATLRQQQAHTIIVATPVAPETTYRELEALVDRMICPVIPASFQAIGEWYANFDQTSDATVLSCLNAAMHAQSYSP